MDRTLLAILACPVCKGELIYNNANEELICKFDRLAFPVVDDIPVMLLEKSKKLSPEDD
jgi:uncharacterized protein YbaR (Trm112 family)